MKIIFLDIDGVLNGYNKWTDFVIDVSRKLHIPVNFMRETLDIFGIKEKYVQRLSKIVYFTGAKVVMSSSWRNGYWKVPYEEQAEDQKILTNLFNKYHIEIIDITPSCKSGCREEEIKEWLQETKLDIESFVILDDESFDLQSFVGKELIKTSEVIEGKMICGAAYEDTGLKRKHVKQAIQILNKR